MGVSEGPIRRGLNMLIQKGVVNVKATLDSKTLSQSTKAIIGIQVDSGKIDVISEGLVK